MSTYAALQFRIASDYLNRTDFSSEVKTSIQAAIRFYERERWRFNETATALTTSAGQTFLTLPTNFLVPDIFQITQSGSRYELERRDLRTILEFRASSATGAPTDYAIYANKAELFAIPDSAYSCPLYYIKSLSALSADADTNAWSEGIMQDLIVHHATKLMWATVIRNDQEALKHQAFETNAYNIARGENNQFHSSKLKATQF